jgi:hypothetical protein
MDNTLSWIFIVLDHWNNSPQVDILLHSDTLFWLRANQSLLFLFNAACLALYIRKINLFSPWYSWKLAELALTNNHTLTQISTNVVMNEH